MTRKFIRDRHGRFGFGGKRDKAMDELSIAQERARDAKAGPKKPRLKKVLKKVPKRKAKKPKVAKRKRTTKKRRRAQ